MYHTYKCFSNNMSVSLRVNREANIKDILQKTPSYLYKEYGIAHLYAATTMLLSSSRYNGFAVK